MKLQRTHWLTLLALTAVLPCCQGNIRDRSRGVAARSAGGDASLSDAPLSLDASEGDDATTVEVDSGNETEVDGGARPDGGSPIDSGPIGTPGQCTDGVDNDGDGLTDSDDLGCTGPNDTTEGGLPSGTIENEWTVFEPTADTRMVYVSRSVGNDSFDGLAPEPIGNGRGPKATLAAGRGLLRAGGSDWLRLRRGDSWSENLRPDAVPGRSPTEPTIYAPYGSGPEPRLSTDATFSANNARNIALLGMDFGSAGVNGNNGSGINNILVEGCRFAGNRYGAIYFVGPSNLSMSNIAIRNNVINSTGDSATYFVSISNALIEGNIIFRPSTINQYNHAMYITRIGNSGIVTRKNLIFMGKPGGMGIMQRPGGISEYNVIADVGASGIPMGECNDEGGPGAAPCLPAVNVTIRHNLIAGIRSDASPGLGIFLKSPYIASGTVENNIVSDSSHGDFQLTNTVSATNNRRFRAPYSGAPTNATLLTAYHLSLGGSGDASAFFTEAMNRHRFHNSDSAYQAQAIIDYAETH